MLQVKYLCFAKPAFIPSINICSCRRALTDADAAAAAADGLEIQYTASLTNYVSSYLSSLYFPPLRMIRRVIDFVVAHK